MGISVASSIKSKSGRRTRAPMADINVTPMVDVMLVLLIVFMVTAPLLTVGVQVDLPNSNASAINDQNEPLVISIADDGQIYMQNSVVPEEALVPRLQAIVKHGVNTPLFVRGDKGIPYGRVMKIMGDINAGGFNKVALITQAPDK